MSKGSPSASQGYTEVVRALAVKAKWKERTVERSWGCLLENGSETLGVARALPACSSETEPDLGAALQRKSWHDRRIVESCDGQNRAGCIE